MGNKNEDQYNDDHLKSLLKEMPKIQDQQDIDELYNQISNRLKSEENTPKVQEKKKKWRITYLVSAALILIGITISSVMIDEFTNDNYSTKQNDASNSTNDEVTEFSAPGESSTEEESRAEIGKLPSAEDQGGENAHTENMDRIGFFGLHFDMTYEDVVQIFGEPKERQQTKEGWELKYVEDDVGIELSMNNEDKTVSEFVFYPRHLAAIEEETMVDPIFFSTHIQEIKDVLGEPENIKTTDCKENSVCEEYSYPVHPKVKFKVAILQKSIESIKLERIEK
ncbi:hypothetical protein [Salinibacillus xinjiangensis]|uniref:DUF4309 domain-containing protein n=1 Tax=Salinibacillus xinjiangensis TaxID=1229268 RepID=A0A6G1X678_9BACI|nr:hypothetical protein [Salinibacillus xinjiangensis]MRG86442.1 hypothetical protein [Salinibacillus xinjiangensis]